MHATEMTKLFDIFQVRFDNHYYSEFILLINVKMPTIVGILAFISMINTTSERLKAKT